MLGVAQRDGLFLGREDDGVGSVLLVGLRRAAPDDGDDRVVANRHVHPSEAGTVPLREGESSHPTTVTRGSIAVVCADPCPIVHEDFDLPWHGHEACLTVADVHPHCSDAVA